MRTEGRGMPPDFDPGRLLKSVSCGLMIASAEGRIQYVNDHLAWALQRTPDEMVGMFTLDTLCPEFRDVALVEREAIIGGDTRARLQLLQRADGTTFPALLLPHLLLDEEGRLEATFSMIIELSTVESAKRVGVPEPYSELARALESIGQQLRSLPAASSVVRRYGPDLHLHQLRDLSKRELEVLHLLMRGDRVPSIAEQLYICRSTVRNHLKSIYRKTGTSSQAELIAFVRGLE